MPTPLRLGILGAGNIARQFATALQTSSLVSVTAVGSRSLEKAKAFAEPLNIAAAHGSYEALLADDGIDAVYVCLPNSMHAEWAIKAAEAGKHVLCEKPLALDGTESRRMFAAADQAGVILREAYPYLAQQQSKIMRGWLREKSIGTPRFISASFGFLFNDPANFRLSPALGGGALYDAGSYAVSLIRVAAGERPTRVQGFAEYDPSGVDRATVATLSFASGLVAQVSATFSGAFHRHALIVGDAGVIETNYLNHPPLGGPTILQMRRGSAAPDSPPVPNGNGFFYEAEAFARLVGGDPDAWSGATPEESTDIMLTLDAIRRSTLNGGWADVAD